MIIFTDRCFLHFKFFIFEKFKNKDFWQGKRNIEALMIEFASASGVKFSFFDDLSGDKKLRYGVIIQSSESSKSYSNYSSIRQAKVFALSVFNDQYNKSLEPFGSSKFTPIQDSIIDLWILEYEKNKLTVVNNRKNAVKIWLYQFCIFVLFSVGGMLISRFIPKEFFWYWVILSLIIGQFANQKIYHKK